MDLSTAKTALDLIGKAATGLHSIRERAKTANDIALKENVSRLYDDFLDLKAIILQLTEENFELKRRIAQESEKQKPQIRQVGKTIYYFVGEEGPFCQKCYDAGGKLVHLMPLDDFVIGSGRNCEVCKTVFIEGPRPPRPTPRAKQY